MGQQQLLLVILVTIIVGIATVVAINTFGAAADSANLDAVRQDVASIAAAAQGYYMKPEMLGGGGQDFTDISFNSMAFPGNIDATGLIAQNENGRYVISGGSNDDFTVTAHPASDEDYVPGNVDADGVLTSTGTDAGETLTATVEPDNMNFGS